MEKEENEVPESSEKLEENSHENEVKVEEVLNKEETLSEEDKYSKVALVEEEIKQNESKTESVKDGIDVNESKLGESEMAEKRENQADISKEDKQTVAETKENKENEPSFKRTEVKPKKSKKGLMIPIIIAIAVIAIMLFSTVFALFHINDTKIINGISILGIDVSGLTADEAKQRINDAITEKFSNENDSIILKRGESEVSVNANTFNAKFDVETAVAEAYNTGRNGNIITDNYAILWTSIFKKEVNPELHYDEEFMKNTISDISSKMKDSIKEYSYYIEGKKLIVVRGKAGYSVKGEELTAKIKEQLEDIHALYKEIEIPVEYKEPSDINLEKIRNEIYKEPKDAYVEKNPTVVHVEENGVDFGISMEEAKKLLKEDKKEYEIPLKITEPKKKLSSLGEEAFPDQLAAFSTIYDASAKNRAYNIELATKKINGTVIMPGETFSYNKTVGSRTIEAGWKEGTAYISGKVVPSVGGGVCQVSSTLYNAALLANLEITERTNHTFTVDYVAASRDATVYYGSLDFCFKNTRSYPVKIVASAKNGVCKISLCGIKEKVEYEVIIQSKITSYITNTTTYKEDPTLEEGKEKIEQYGFNGCRSEGYKILKLNGKVVSQTLLSKDTYSPQERIVRRGTKKVSKPVTTTPDTTDPATEE